MSLQEFRDRIRDYRVATGFSQKALAAAVGLHPTVLSAKLNGSAEARLNYQEIKQIIKTLAEWQAITTRTEVEELLASLNLKPALFTPLEWKAAPLADLTGTLASDTLSPPEVNLPRLPYPTTPLVGRQAEIKAVSKLLFQPGVSLLTLTGAGGTGKTRLALAVADHLKNRFLDGVYFVPLAMINDRTQAEFAIAQAVKLPEGRRQSLEQGLQEYLKTRQLLLVLDNFEQLTDAVDLVAGLVENCPGLKILVTSRSLLRINGEHEFSVPPLQLPAPDRLPALTLAQIAAHDAISLYLQRVRAVIPNFELTVENVPAVVEVCRHLDGLPLAIELAAARHRLFSPQMLLDRLVKELPGNTRLDLQSLGSGPETSPARQQTLIATLDWSYNLLDESGKQLFRRLGVFVGGDIKAACTVLDHPDRAELLEQLTALVNQSLVRGQPIGEDGFTFGLLHIVREYALAKLEESGEADLYRRRHALYYLSQTLEYNVRLDPDAQTNYFTRLESLYPNLRAALEWSLNSADEDDENPLATGLRLASRLKGFWEKRGYLAEGRNYLTALLARAGDNPEITLPLAIISPAFEAAGRLAYLQGDYDAANLWLNRCLDLYSQQDEEDGLAQLLLYLGNVALRQSDYIQAQFLFERSLGYSRAAGDKALIADALNSLGLAEWFQGNYVAAHRDYTQSLALWQELGDKSGLAMTGSNIGAVFYQQGDYRACADYNRQSLDLWRALGEQTGIATALQHLSLVAYVQEDLQIAQRFVQQSLVIRLQLGDKWGQGRCYGILGEVYLWQERWSEAEDYLNRSLALRRELNDRWGVATSLANLGYLNLALGNAVTAYNYFFESLELGVRYAMKLQVARCLEGLAALDLTQNDASNAAFLVGAATGLRALIGSSRTPLQTRQIHVTVQTARSALGETTFTARYERGYASQIWELEPAHLKTFVSTSL